MRQFLATYSYFNGKYWSRDQTSVIKASNWPVAARRAAKEAKGVVGRKRIEGLKIDLKTIGEVKVETLQTN